MSTKLHLKGTTQLTITPVMHYFIQLLTTNRVELIQSILNEADTNPMLEIETQDPGPPEPEVNNFEKRLERADTSFFQTYVEQGFFKRDPDEVDKNRAIENLTPSRETLQDYLMQQAQVAFFSEKELEIARQIIYNLDAGGYLKVEIESIASLLGSTPVEIENTRNVIKNFDPVGCASRTLKECLLAQLGDEKEFDQLRLLIENHLEDLSRSRYDIIARSMGITVEDILKLAAVLKKLTPRPAEEFETEDVEYAEVDMMLIKEKNDYKVVYIEEGIPRPILSQYYREMLDKTHDKKAVSYIKERYRDAQFFIESVELRKNTILRIAEYLVKMQKDYLDFGEKWKRPLTMKDVAGALSLNESTISRAVNNKFMATDNGLLSLRSFFSYGIKGDFGFVHSVETIKEKIREIIQNEPEETPLSDDEISAALEGLGIHIARRTVRNYREEMGIPSSFIRKKENKIKGAKA